MTFAIISPAGVVVSTGEAEPEGAALLAREIALLDDAALEAELTAFAEPMVAGLLPRSANVFERHRVVAGALLEALVKALLRAFPLPRASTGALALLCALRLALLLAAAETLGLPCTEALLSALGRSLFTGALRAPVEHAPQLPFLAVELSVDLFVGGPRALA